MDRQLFVGGALPSLPAPCWPRPRRSERSSSLIPSEQPRFWSLLLLVGDDPPDEPTAPWEPSPPSPDGYPFEPSLDPDPDPSPSPDVRSPFDAEPWFEPSSFSFVPSFEPFSFVQSFDPFSFSFAPPPS